MASIGDYSPGQSPFTGDLNSATDNWSLDNLTSQIANSELFTSIPVVRNCPGTDQWGDCQYLSTPQPGDGRQVTWTCAPGYYCLTSASIPEKCPPGFYCPANTWQPLYCNRRYYCSNDTAVIYRCPTGYFCPMGSVQPVSCGQFSCPAGSSLPGTTNAVLVFLMLLFIVAGLGFFVKDQYIGYRRLLQKRILAETLLQQKVRDQVAERRAVHEQSANALAGLSRHNSITHRRQASMASVRSLGAAAPPSPTKLAASLETGAVEEPVERTPFDISFEGLSFELPGGVSIINSATGRFFPGRCCAVMGPSGAGKTSLISLILGKTQRSQGTVYVNNEANDLSVYQKIIGFVPQEDVMLRELTVESVLTHSAFARLPASMPRSEKASVVTRTLAFLELSHVFDSIIGDEENRGISGGQRKRVNIGMELVADPSILILDEPTSGLDSSTSLQVCSMLHDLAIAKNVVVISIIHSPSMHTYEQFDDLMLLGKGGNVVYHGPRPLANKWFKRCGFPVPDHENPADFFMDCIMGNIPCRIDDLFSPRDFFKLWARHGHAFLVEHSVAYFPDTQLPAGVARLGPGPNLVSTGGSAANGSLLATAASNRLQGASGALAVKKRSGFSATLPHASSDSNLAALGLEASASPLSSAGPALADSHTNTSLPDTPSSNHAGYIEPSHATQVGDVVGSAADVDPRDSGRIERSYARFRGAAVHQFETFRQTIAAPIAQKSAAAKNAALAKLDEMRWTRQVRAWMYNMVFSFYLYVRGLYRELVSTGLRSYRFILRKKDPVRTTPSVYTIFYLCTRRALLQAFKNAKSFFLQLIFHAVMGSVVSLATQDFRYIGRNPDSICNITPASLQLSCRSPNDALRFMGMLFCWGSMLGGVTMALRTFGHEKAVFWREAAGGQPLLPYFFAKMLVDMCRILIASVIYSLAFILFFPFMSSYATFLGVSFLLYFVATGMGYFLSMVLNRAVAPLAGVGLSIATALFFSGALSPSVQDLTDPTQGLSAIKFLWDWSGPRWGVEAIWIRETENLPWYELHQNGDQAMYGYWWSNYPVDLRNMVVIGVVWMSISFAFMKLLDRKKM